MFILKNLKKNGSFLIQLHILFINETNFDIIFVCQDQFRGLVKLKS